MAKPSHAPLPAPVVDGALREVEGGLRLVVSVKPKSAKEGLEAGPEGALVVRVSAPPVEGKANARVIEVVAARLGVRKGDVSIARGEGARHKELAVSGLSLDEARARLTAG